MMRTANPTLRDDVFTRDRGSARDASNTMTIAGTVNKAGILMMITLLTGMFSFNASYQQGTFGEEALFVPNPMLFGGMIAGLILALIIIFKATTAPVLAPLYAAAEGLFLGGISAAFEAAFPGIVIQAFMCTIGVFAALLGAYRSGLIQATENFKLGMAAAMGGIFIVYLLNFVLGFFGVNIPFIHSTGMMGIGFSLFVVVIAALNLVLDFDFIENGEAQGAPKYMEWYGAFGLLVTLVWLYVEILRLLSILRGDD